MLFALCGLIYVLAVILVVGMEYYSFRTYTKYGRAVMQLRISGCEMARRVLDWYGLSTISVSLTKQKMTRLFHPIEGILSLPEDIYDHSSLTAIGHAAYEAGWASEISKKPALGFLSDVTAFWSSVIAPFGFLFLLLGMTIENQQFLFVSGAIIFAVYLGLVSLLLHLRFNVIWDVLGRFGEEVKLRGMEERALRSVMIERALSEPRSVVYWLRYLVNKLYNMISGGSH